MPDTIRVTEEADDETLLRDLAMCSGYPQSARRTRSTDVLLDLWLERRTERDAAR